jgi:signal peptidase I
MTEENRVTPAGQRVAPQPRAHDSDSPAFTDVNGQQTTGTSQPATTHHKLRALALRLAVSALLFVVLAVLSIGVMLVVDVRPQTALGVGLLGSFLAVMAVQNFLPISARQPTEPSGKPTPAAGSSLAGDFLMLLRWLAGLLIVLVCGWVCLGVTAYVFWTSTTEHAFQLALLAAAALSLGAFYLLERDLWLSRLMGLHVGPDTSPLWSAVWLWLFGVAGLLLRSTHRAEAATEPKAKETQQPTDSMREVIETVVFVVVLVLLLKSFVAEAFVIPTGSMAETLYGYQKDITCPKCKYVFPVNVSQWVDPSEGTPQKVTGCICPNCREPIVVPDDNQWSSGDRVLVGKYFYELVDQPERLEVVVFKYPGDDSWPHKGPVNNHIPLNYIKRLIGKPGETIAIYQGKLYVLSPEQGTHYKDWDQAQQDPEVMARLWQTKYQHVNDARDEFEQGKFTLVRKPPDTMLAMSRIVYDNDHPPSDIKVPRWSAPGTSWVAGNATDFTNPGGSGAVEWLRYSHVLRDPTGRAQVTGKMLITDFTGYNTFVTGIHPHPPPENWVGDLLLECEVTLDKPEGTLVLQLSKSRDRFEARWNLATGECDLFRLHDGRQPEKLGSAKTTLSAKGRTYRVRIANVDQKLTVWVDNTLPFGEDGAPYSIAPTEATGPTEENDLEPASIGVQGGAVKVRKIKLFRDTYYTNEPGKSDFGIDMGDKNTWQKMDHFRKDSVKTIYVQPHHYLCLGDNSPESSDGRSWGSVPERLLLGRAMLVYYPLPRAGKIR